MKNYKTHAECAHAYAHKLTGDGRSGPLFFRGDTIFSYGEHYPIAKRIRTPTDTTVYFFNDEKSSITTETKHKNSVKRALNYAYYSIPSAIWNDPHKIIEYFSVQHKECVKQALRKPVYGVSELVRAESLKQTAIRFAEEFGLQFDTEEFSAITTEIRQKVHSKCIEYNATKEARAKKSFTEQLLEWRQGKRRALNLPYDMDNRTTFLRTIFPTQVETSKNISITLKQARWLWEAIKHARSTNTDLQSIGKIGSFNVDTITATGDILAGCHWIKYEESLSAAQALDFSVSEVHSRSDIAAFLEA
jgi:hypothetical protein